MHDDSRLAGARTGKHQMVAVLGHRHQRLLNRVSKVVDDPTEGLIRGRKFQEIRPALEEFANKAPSRH